MGYDFRALGCADVKVSATVGNIFDARYASSGWAYSCYEQGERADSKGLFPQAGRNFMANVVISF